MLKGITMINEEEDGKSKLNNLQDLHINRGFELMLKHISKREKSSEPKTFQLNFGKMLSLFDREIHFKFDFFFNIKKK